MLRCVRACRTERCIWLKGYRLRSREGLRHRLHKWHLGWRQHLGLLLSLCRGSSCSLLRDDGLPKGELSLSISVVRIVLRECVRLL